MNAIMISAALYAAALTVKKVWGSHLASVPILRDTDLSLNGFISAMGIVLLIVTGITLFEPGNPQSVQVTDPAETVVTQEAESHDAAADQSSDQSGSATVTLPEASTEESESSEEKSEVPEENSEGSAAAVQTDAPWYADGTFSGTGNGFRGPITVAVEIAGGVISRVEVTEEREDRQWFERAYAGVAQQIVSSQSADVDIVSGATYSSRGIIDGAAAALEEARAAGQKEGL